MTIEADTKDLKRLEKALADTKKSAFPYAVRQTLNSLAFEGQRQWRQEMVSKLTLRNRYTQQSIRVDQAKGTQITGMKSVVGSIAAHVAELEDGETVTAKGKHGAPIPTLTSRGGNPKRLVSRPNKLGSIKLSPGKGKTSKQRNAVAIATARRTGRKFAFLDLGKTKGIFKVTQSKRRKGGAKMVWSLSRKSFRTEPRPTMQVAMMQANKKAPSFYRTALLKQLSMHGFR